MNFADMAIEKRKVDDKFFNSINNIIDWKSIENFINQHYKKGNRIDGRPAFPGLVLFKLCLLKKWYNLSDNQLVAHVNDSISFTRFINLSLEDEVPSTGTIKNFRFIMRKKGKYEELLKMVNNKLNDNNIEIQRGTLREAKFIHKS